jgi:hypothetical protein
MCSISAFALQLMTVSRNTAHKEAKYSCNHNAGQWKRKSMYLNYPQLVGNAHYSPTLEGYLYYL